MPDQEPRPGSTLRTVMRGWGVALLVFAGGLFLLSAVAAAFGVVPALLVAVLMLPLLLVGGHLVRRGRSRSGSGREDLDPLARRGRQVRLDDEAAGSAPP